MSTPRNGSVRKRGDRWEARWYDPDGNRRSSRRWLDEDGQSGAIFKTRAEAQRFATEKQMEARRARDGRGSYVDRAARRPPFREMAVAWMETGPGSTTKTRMNYASILSNHLIPEFGSTPIDEIGPTRLKRYRAKLEKEGKSAGTIKNIFRVLSPIFEMAIDDELIARNPVRRVKVAKETTTRASILTPDQVALLAESIDEHYAGLVLVGAYSGARWGEIAALRWRHISITRHPATDDRPERIEVDLTIEASVAEVCISEKRRAEWGFDTVGLVTGPTKNKRSRVVRVPSRLLDLLTPANDPNALVFTTENGTPLRPDNFRKRVWIPAVAKARLADPSIPERFRFHDLRHTCASLLIEKGYNPKKVQEHMGHSQIGVTFDVYGHLFDDAFDSLGDEMDDVIADASAARARAKLRAAS